MNIKLENYGKETPAHWQRIGDFFLFSIPVVNGVLMTMPDIEHGAAIKAWIIFGWNMLASIVKIFTKYMAHDEIKDNQ